jgi:hypothetical protein
MKHRVHYSESYRESLLSNFKKRKELRNTKKNDIHKAIENQIKMSWDKIKHLTDASLRIVKLGYTAFYDEEVERNHNRIVQMSLIYEADKYKDLSQQKIIDCDIMELTDYVLFHEVGHSVHQELINVREDRKMIIREARKYHNERNKELFAHYFNKALEYTLIMENYAWDFALTLLTERHNLKKFNEFRNYAIKTYTDDHENKYQFFLKAF